VDVYEIVIPADRCVVRDLPRADAQHRNRRPWLGLLLRRLLMLTVRPTARLRLRQCSRRRATR
jgi:hypothetical protein